MGRSPENEAEVVCQFRPPSWCHNIFLCSPVTQAARRRIELEIAETNPGLIQRWFPGWISGYQARTPQGEEKKGEEEEEMGEGRTENRSNETQSTTMEQSGNAGGNEVLSVEEGELLQELGYEADHDNVFLRDRIFLTLAFSLGGGSFQLVTTPLSQDASCLGPEPLVEFRFESLRAAADIRPRLRYASYDISLGSLTVRDHIDSESLFPVLVQAKGAKVRLNLLMLSSTFLIERERVSNV